MKVIILAGGGGTRLFPLSRSAYPKQFLKLFGTDSLLVATIKRFLGLVQPEEIVVVTGQQYKQQVEMDLATSGLDEVRLLLEPSARNTAPAIALAVRYAVDEMQATAGEVLFIAPSDHIIQPVEAFQEDISKVVQLADAGYLLTLGIKPDKPETGYGYIQAGEALQAGFRVAAFREKPDAATAAQWVASGGYYWNGGMFAGTTALFMQEFAVHAPAIGLVMQKPLPDVIAAFDTLPNISIDYAVAERSDKMAVVPLSAKWNDIGSWDAIYDVMKKDACGNAIEGDILPVGCKNSLFMGKSRLIAGVGLEDVLVVETDDVIVVAQRGASQEVKTVVETLKQTERKEAHEATTSYRPWGSYTILGQGDGYKMKRIVVKPGERLSLQLHYHRSEHWIVTAGTAEVTIGQDVRLVHKNESVFVPLGSKHRLANPGKLPLEIIEIQNGDYLEEDDIVRFEDIYGRA